MSRELVLIHGRGQQGRDASQLKQEWLESLTSGLANNDPPLPPIDATAIRFPFYGDTLDQMNRGAPADEAAEVILRGDPALDNDEKRFMLEVLDQIRDKYGISDTDVLEAVGEPIRERGPLNSVWVRAVLQTLDAVPGLSAATIAGATRDVYQYLANGVVRLKIDTGVMQAITPDVESVVVGHSLGSVVAYTLLQREGVSHGWKVPLFVTVGSPLAVNAIRNWAPVIAGVGGNRTPECVSEWFNAMDPRDVVSLYPLDIQHFPLNPTNPAIENKTDVDNFTSNRHGISGYLRDSVVAKRVYDALNDG